jgi:hypothetical protein
MTAEELSAAPLYCTVKRRLTPTGSRGGAAPFKDEIEDAMDSGRDLPSPDSLQAASLQKARLSTAQGASNGFERVSRRSASSDLLSDETARHRAHQGARHRNPFSATLFPSSVPSTVLSSRNRVLSLSRPGLPCATRLVIDLVCPACRRWSSAICLDFVVSLHASPVHS